MYLKSKAAGVQINKMYIPKYLVGFTARIINFVLETPFIDTGKAEFIIEKGEKNMTNFQNEEIIANEESLNETIVNEGQKTDEISEKNKKMSEQYKEILKDIALMSTMMKLKDIDKRLKALEERQCPCSSHCNSEANKEEIAA